MKKSFSETQNNDKKNGGNKNESKRIKQNKK